MSRLLISCLLVCGVLTLGCQSKATLDGLVPASGTVTFNGQPVDGAMLIFVPETRTDTTRGAGAQTNDKGGFTLMTRDPNDGALPGKYRVTASKIEYGGGTPDDGDDRSRAPSQRTMRRFLPAKYESEETTDIVVDIPPKGDRKIAIALTGEVDSKETPLGRGGPGSR